MPLDTVLSRRACVAAAAALGMARAFGSEAEPLRLLVAYPPGGPTDVLARQMEPVAQRALARRVLVDNVPGVAGGLGVQRLLAATGPSPTVLVGSPSETLLAPLVNKTLRYQPEQLRLIGLVTHLPVALVGGAHLVEPNLAALLQRRTAASPSLSYGSYGIGSHAHLVGEDFSARARLPLLHVPYNGVAPLLRDLVGRQIDLAFLPLTLQVHDLVDQGRLRMYGLASSRASLRSPTETPIERHAGFDGFRHDLWSGVFVARTAPAAWAEQAQQLVRAVSSDPAFAQRKKEEGIEVASPVSAAAAETWFAAEVGRYRTLVERLAIGLNA